MNIVVLILGLTFPSMATATDNLESMVQKIIKMRQETELLNSEYKAEKETLLNELKSLTLQKTELESNIRREQLQKKQLQMKLSQSRKQMKNQDIQGSQWKPLVTQTFTAMKDYLDRALPVKKDERLEALLELEKQFESGDSSTAKTLIQLWSFYQDELRWAGETQITQQTITIAGAKKMASLAKVGGLFLYYKTQEGQVGRAEKQQSSEHKTRWTFAPYSSESTEGQQILSFFDSLKKQIHQGDFTLPIDSNLEGSEVL